MYISHYVVLHEESQLSHYVIVCPKSESIMAAIPGDERSMYV